MNTNDCQRKLTNSFILSFVAHKNVISIRFDELFKSSITNISEPLTVRGWYIPWRATLVVLVCHLTHWGRHFRDDIFKCIFIHENIWIAINISLKFVPDGLIINISALVQIMAWRRPGDKPLSATILVSLLAHKRVTRPQWVNVDVKPN